MLIRQLVPLVDLYKAFLQFGKSNNKNLLIWYLILYRIKSLSEEIIEFLRQAQRSVFELRKSDAFWSAFQAFVETAFSQTLLSDATFEEVLLEIAKIIFEEANLVHGMAYVVVNQVTFKEID